MNGRYSASQLSGVMFVILGSLLAATATSSSSASGNASVPYMLLMNVVFILLSISFVTKEKIFVDFNKRVGQNLDIFVVNSFGSLAQVPCPICVQADRLNS